MFSLNFAKSKVSKITASFSGGPYNPKRYKTYTVARSYASNKDINEFMHSVAEIPDAPVRNLRHINPVR